MISYMAWLGPPENRQIISLDGVDGVAAIPDSGILLATHDLLAFPAGDGPGPCDTIIVTRKGSQAASVLFDAAGYSQVVGIAIRGNAGGVQLSGLVKHLGPTRGREIFVVGR